ncbi:hypothetical protein BDN67DRAFT_992726 [Paxillus ammoniavirescens]|nr:hypothetical protein BDN67DRAFT_992726 [Paxillus ammoniavirescens]
MKLPTSVLEGCGESFLPADNKGEKVLWLVNMTSSGEKQHYALALIQHLFDHIPPDMAIGIFCRKWGLLDPSIILHCRKPRLTFGISVFYVYGHQWPYQILYHPCKCIGFGLTNGEGCEQL